MANPYLILALYGPKPTAPATATNACEAENDQPALQPRTLSLAQQLYGSEHISDTHKAEYTHPSRRNQDNVDGRWHAKLAKGGSE
jgi:hypothetical protein